ncbi:hypothetical protein JWG42_14480 [Desulfoprunum benzoelyticum]|uniref:Uncharacterized protein n=1 Tax=Desulfoprunum benzoelyticum TaxID=1506996 RepID=A0A840UWV2_9BACT|nr:hypothetical protein [Desulfoprunum benzoelyticum]MBB5347168.1 hypothetical protein [Desulfoprunum benzoelyticum]MBM9531364.1 hypothetical protein [Desulfoprunum benzoelyticum]
MGNAELSFARQNALSTRDWDTYQLILRRCLGQGRPAPNCSGVPRKTAVITAAVAGRPPAVAR